MENNQKHVKHRCVLFINQVADKLNTHWIWKTIITFFPSLWLPFIVKYKGRYLQLLDNESTLTSIGFWLTIIIYLVAFSLMLLSNIRTRDEESRQQKYRNTINVLENTNRFFSNLLSSVHGIGIEKSSSIIDAVNLNLTQDGNLKDFLKNINPLQQLKHISNEICSCFHEQTSINKDKLIVSMAYCLGEDCINWQWVDFQAVRGGLTLNELITNQNTVFYRLMKGQIDSKFIFINDKAIAKAKNEYVSDERDKKYRDQGSLVSAEISVEANTKPMARLIISVSSYSKKISNNDCEEVLSAVEENLQAIFIQFEEQIRTELSLLYLQHENQNQSIKGTNDAPFFATEKH